MSETAALPVWKCEFNEAPGSVSMNALTVGAKFQAKCAGDIAVEWPEGGMDVVFPKKEEAFALAVLEETKLGTNEVELVVTAYKPGKHAPEYVRFVKGGVGFEVAKPEWEVQSVLKPNEPAQPYPPFGPWGLAFPMWVLVLAAAILALAMFFIFRKLRRYNQRQRMLADLARHKTALAPINQFYRDSRQLRRRLDQAKSAEELKILAEELNKEFRLYVLRQFQIPTFDWSDRAIVDDLRKRHRKVYSEAGDRLRKTLRELSRMTAQNQILLPDIEQLHRMSLDTAERIEAAGRGGRA